MTTPTHALVGFFHVDGNPSSVEVPLTGTPADQYSALAAAIKAKHPTAQHIHRLSSRIEPRGAGEGFVEVHDGATIRNLFAAPEGKEDPCRTIGKTFFSGAPYDVTLLFVRAAGVAAVHLKPRMSGHSPIKFHNQINPQQLVTELPRIIDEVLGRDAKETELYIRTSK